MTGMTGISPHAASVGVSGNLLSTREIAGRYAVHPRTVIRWITTRGLPGTRVGGQWRVAQQDMDSWLTSGRVTADR